MFQANSAYPLKRLALKVLFLLAFSAVQWRVGILRSASLSFFISSNLSFYLALMGKAKILLERRFTYWDEAVAFLALSVLADLGTRS
jgi:hypothetical protein